MGSKDHIFITAALKNPCHHLLATDFQVRYCATELAFNLFSSFSEAIRNGKEYKSFCASSKSTIHIVVL
jgi:hypothetical protein